MVLNKKTIKEAFEVVRTEHTVYVPSERVLVKCYSGQYDIFNFGTKERIIVREQNYGALFLYEKEYIELVCNEYSVPNVKVFRETFTDKDMLEPIELGNLKDFSKLADKITLATMIKIIRHKNVKAIMKSKYTDDYAFDNAYNFMEGKEIDKFQLINDLKRYGSKAYKFFKDHEGKEQINGSFYTSEFFKIVIV